MNAPDSDVNQSLGHEARGQRLLDTDTSSVTSAQSAESITRHVTRRDLGGECQPPQQPRQQQVRPSRHKLTFTKITISLWKYSNPKGLFCVNKKGNNMFQHSPSVVISKLVWQTMDFVWWIISLLFIHICIWLQTLNLLNTANICLLLHIGWLNLYLCSRLPLLWHCLYIQWSLF